MPEPAIEPPFITLSIALSRPEVDLLHDAVAGWLARYLVHREMMDGEPADGFDFETMTMLGRKLGMNL
jgi:hypothetical protein